MTRNLTLNLTVVSTHLNVSTNGNSLLSALSLSLGVVGEPYAVVTGCVLDHDVTT